jgi:hypothetical protein
VPRWSASSWGRTAGTAQEAAQGGAADGDALAFSEQLGEVAVVDAGIRRLGQLDDPDSRLLRARSREWAAVGPTEIRCVQEMARCLRELREGRWPE